MRTQDAERIARIAPVLLPRLDSLSAEWRRTHPAPETPDLPELTRSLLEHGLPAALQQQERLAHWLVTQGTPLDHVMEDVLDWEEHVQRVLVLHALEDVFTAASALNRFLHRLVVKVAEGYEASVRQSLEETEHLKGELISMVSHDLQTPLTTIQGCAHALLEGDPSPTEREKFHAMIAQNAGRLSRLISQLMDLSSIEQRAVQLRPDTIDLRSTARTIVDGIPARVHLEAPPDLPAVRADRDAVERILVNLIDNALRFSPPGQTVTVELRPDDDHAVLARVVDRGPGIPADRRGGLFTRFFQVEPSHNGRRTGTGLGLAIVRGLAEAMGGRAGYEANHPEGSVFWVRLPSAS